jgi:flavin reductase (DIM6/NTAB) family NADH-FMN oxidoreductase RutF
LTASPGLAQENVKRRAEIGIPAPTTEREGAGGASTPAAGARRRAREGDEMTESSDLRDRFLEAMSRAASVVCIVTTDGPAGQLGTTVSSMCSVSADPPAVLVCINASHASSEAIEQNGVFCVNILGGEHQFVADVFAGRVQDLRQRKFDSATWEKMATGAPVLAGTLAAFDCRLTHSIVIGSHRVMVGEVVELSTREGDPLVYSNRAYRSLIARG